MESRTLENRFSGETSPTNSQFAAIRFSVQLGRDLRESLPQIADEFRNGKFIREIVEDHDIALTYGISESTAIKGVRYALMGYDSDWDFLNEKNYDGLIPENEYQSIGKEHRLENIRETDKKMKKNKKGIYGISKNQRKLNGKKGARVLIERKIGIHGQTHESRQKVAKWGALARGFTLWTDEEKIAAFDMATQQDCTYRIGSKIARGKIAQELNGLYHDGNEIRTAGAVGRFLNDYKK